MLGSGDTLKENFTEGVLATKIDVNQKTRVTTQGEDILPAIQDKLASIESKGKDTQGYFFKESLDQLLQQTHGNIPRHEKLYQVYDESYGIYIKDIYPYQIDNDLYLSYTSPQSVFVKIRNLDHAKSKDVLSLEGLCYDPICAVKLSNEELTPGSAVQMEFKYHHYNSSLRVALKKHGDGYDYQDKYKCAVLTKHLTVAYF
ncbi:hypothetical protein INT47_000070 [Mucor saturninus]|uniref:Uncharacterized protein n=1 Tax=Mucor saturninus TaxID=64648 RepID=A0A8H7RJS1_9FUNG|nr:hypothetical protein INT47_000070 [Mucor saturninus]